MPSNQELVNYLISQKYLQQKPLINAFKKIDRKDFLPPQQKKHAYLNQALGIGFNQTISQPLVVAFMLELLDLKKNQKVLDIGTGSAYTTALIAEVLGSPQGITGLERIPQLVKQGNENLQKYFPTPTSIILLAQKDLGFPEQTFDRILVSAAAEEMPPKLTNQLREGGKLVIPIRNSIFLVEKTKNQTSEKEYFGFSFVPLIIDD